MPIDSLVEELVTRADEWANQRDYEPMLRPRWRQYYRTWRGYWSAEDRERNSERSQAIMPSTAQAIDAAVADVVEALFSREQWLDTGIPMLDDLLIADLMDDRPNIEEAVLLGALYGSIISKIVVEEVDGRPVLSTQALHPEELIVDPSATSLSESMGVGHHVFVPRWVVERRMRDGVYEPREIEGSGEMYRTDPGQFQPRDSEYIELLEWHGLVPIEEVEARQRTDQLRESAIGDDKLVEAICTVANKEVMLRCEANPHGDDRPFVLAQWHTVPRQIWGRGVAEASYWPQKALDTEMRARADALAFSNSPMMAVSSGQVPRSERFEVKPGRNVFVRGDARTAMAPLQFAGPDPGTYQQSLEMQRMIEMGTGQFTNASPLNDISRTGTGPLSAILGASVKRSARTMLNIQRDFIEPLITKAVLRMNAIRPNVYPQLSRRPKVISGLGLMQRELESQQLASLMASLQDGPAKLALLRMVVEGTAVREKARVLELIDEMTERALAPQGMSPQEELVLKQLQQQEAATQGQLQLDMAKLRLEQQRAESEHRRRMIELGIKAEEVDAKIKQLEASAGLDEARSEAIQ